MVSCVDSLNVKVAGVTSVRESVAIASSSELEEPPCWVVIPNILLVEWHKQVTPGRSYIELVNESIISEVVCVDTCC